MGAPLEKYLDVPRPITTLSERYPHLDDWLYRLDASFHGFRQADAYREVEGMRTVHRVTFEGIYAYSKFDQQGRFGRYTYDGARDKIAADLAQLSGVYIPSALVWKVVRGGAGNDHGCLQKEPPSFHVTLERFCRTLDAMQSDDLRKEEALSRLASAYEPRNFFFDLWVGNTDRRTNYNNLLISETSTNTMCWLIDYNNSLGHEPKQWSADHGRIHGFRPENVPIPLIIAGRPEWKKRIDESLSNETGLEAVDDLTIDELCDRAFHFYDDEEGRRQARLIAECLKERKGLIKEWAAELLEY